MSDGRDRRPPSVSRQLGPDVPRHQSRKDTRRWCKGKVGREHRGEWIPANEVKGQHGWSGTYRMFVCRECDKQINHSWPMGETVPGLRPTATCKCGRMGRGIVTLDYIRRKQPHARVAHYTCSCGFAWSAPYAPTPEGGGKVEP